jgi:hypothetical protein
VTGYVIAFSSSYNYAVLANGSAGLVFWHRPRTRTNSGTAVRWHRKPLLARCTSPRERRQIVVFRSMPDGSRPRGSLLVLLGSGG